MAPLVELPILMRNIRRELTTTSSKYLDAHIEGIEAQEPPDYRLNVLTGDVEPHLDFVSISDNGRSYEVSAGFSLA